jgi:hypothetical protein
MRCCGCGWAGDSAIKCRLTVGPVEETDANGFVVSGADVELIPTILRPVLESCVSTVVSGVPGLVAMYVYGSVATDRASPDGPTSTCRSSRGCAESLDAVSRVLKLG